MSVGYRNLSGSVRGLLEGNYPDIGQTYYLVDSDYRTAAQGWSRADRTGPLDLFSERNPGYVFRTADYTTDAVALQAAIDAQVDFRGDTLYFTPGAYSIATVRTLDVADSRWLGSPVGHPVAARATITAAVAAALNMTTAADRMEFGFLRFVPLTASHIFAVDTGVGNSYFHHFFYDSNGVAANAATQMVLCAGSWDDTVLEDFYFVTDGAQGPLIELDGTAVNLVIQRFLHMHNAGTLTLALLDVDGAGASCITIGPGHGQIGADGIVTNLFDYVDMTSNATNITLKEFTGSVGYATNATITPAAGAAAESDIVSSWIATIGGGAGRAAYIGTS